MANQLFMIKPLTSLRFVFALMVFVSHLGFVKEKDSTLASLFNNILYEGYIGVSFFFILSGFILSYRYQNELLNGKTSKKSFYNARIARIFPLHLLTFLIAIPLTFYEFAQDKLLYSVQAFTNITLTQSFVPNRIIYYSFNSPSWSISNEMFFYLLFPLIMVFFSRYKQYLKALIPLIIILIPILSLKIPEIYHHQLFYINPLFRIVDFIIGILLYMIFKRYKEKKTHINFTYLEITTILILVLFIAFHKFIPEVSRYSYYYWIPMSLLIIVFAFQRGSLSKLLSHKVFMHLGHISFSFYLFHQLIIRYTLKINSKFFDFENDILLIVFMFIMTLLVSHFGFIWFEKPMNRYTKNLLQKLKLGFKPI